ncbi:MAG: MFS transporter [Candidatus Hodarchaeota archaeon]
MKNKKKACSSKMNKYLWFVLIFAGIVTFFDGWCSVAISLALGSYKGTFELNLEQFLNPDLFTYFGIAGNPVTMGIILSIAGIGVVAAVSFKYLVDKYGRRPLTLFTSIAFITFSILTAFSPPGSDGLIYFLIVRILANFFLTADIVTIIMAEEAPNDLRGRLISLVLAMNAIGGMACGIIQVTGIRVRILPYITLTTWQSIFFLSSIGYFFIIPLFFFLKETKRFEAMKKYEKWRKKKGLKPKTGWLAPLKKEYRRVLVLGCVVGFLGTLLSFAKLRFFALFFAKELNMPSKLIGFVSLPMLLAAGIGFLIAGPIIDRWGRRTAIHRSGLIVLVGGVVFFWPAVFVCGDIPNPLLIFLAVAGGAFGILGSTIMTTAGVVIGLEMTPTHIRSTSRGWIAAISRGATILAPFLIMFGAEKSGGLGLSYHFMFANMGLILTTILFTAYLLAPESKGRELEEIVVTEIYSKKKKMDDKKHKEPYYFYLLCFIAHFNMVLVYSLTINASPLHILAINGFYSGLALICFLIVIRVREMITDKK